MTMAHLVSGELDPSPISERWILVLGGVTRQGHRRASRAAATALASGLDVVWFDGYDETEEGFPREFPSAGKDEGGHLVTVDFAEAESHTVSGRLRDGGRLKASPMGRWVWKQLLRRIGSLLRPRACWATIRSDIRILSDRRTPDAIVYTDPVAITSAWYAARIWTGVSVSTAAPGGYE